MTREQNLSRFLDEIGHKHGPITDYEPAIYYEFAFLRDAWHGIKANNVKRELIEQFLPKGALPSRSLDTPLAFNGHFGVAGKASNEHIQSPGKWSLTGFDGNVECNDAFRATCLFKWAFNAKPDLVIQTAPNQCVCIEAKLDSGETSYPSSKGDKGVFKNRRLSHVRQTEVQSYLMNEILGFDADNILLSKHGRERSSFFRAVSWRTVLEALSLERLPKHMKLSLKAKFDLKI